MTVDILFPVRNRVEFTEVALDCLVRNTNWRLVNRLVIYDDGSRPHQLERIAKLIPSPGEIQVPVDFRHTDRLGPPGVMLDYLRHDPSEVFVKIDNDIAVPKLWLEDLTSGFDDEVELLGMEIGMPHGLNSTVALAEGERTWIPSSHIGGVGMMRRSAFERRGSIVPSGRFGFTEWQHTYRPKRGWIYPEINAPCLDRLPIEPYVGLSIEYEARGWQRKWWKYPLAADRYWSWMTEGVTV